MFPLQVPRLLDLEWRGVAYTHLTRMFLLQVLRLLDSKRNEVAYIHMIWELLQQVQYSFGVEGEEVPAKSVKYLLVLFILNEIHSYVGIDMYYYLRFMKRTLLMEYLLKTYGEFSDIF